MSRRFIDNDDFSPEAVQEVAGGCFFTFFVIVVMFLVSIAS